MTRIRRRWLWVLLAVAGLGLVVRLTLVPTSGPDTGIFRLCVLCGDFGLSDFLANVILFAPVGVALYFAGVSARLTIGALCSLSVAIELAQLWIPGRDSALGDVIANTLGAAVGVALAWWWPRRRRSGRAATASAGAIVALIAGTGVVLQPSLPLTTYFGQWTADLGMYEWYRGTVVSAEISGMPLPSSRLPDSRTIREHLLVGEPLRIRAVAGPRTRDLAPIFSIFDEARTEVLLVGPDRDDLVLHVRTRASDLRLHQPELRWRGAMAGIGTGDSLALEVRRTARGYCVTMNGRQHCGLVQDVGEAWELMQALPHARPAARAILDCVPLVLAGLLVGLLSPRRRSGYLAIGILLAGVTMLPPLVGLAWTPPLQLAALVLSVVVAGLIPEPYERTHAPVDAVVA